MTLGGDVVQADSKGDVRLQQRYVVHSAINEAGKIWGVFGTVLMHAGW